MSGRRPSFLDRRAVFASGAAAALLAATGAGAAGLPRRGGQLRLALSGAQRTDSWTQGDGLFMQVARVGLVHDTLTEIAADGTLRGDLALGWECGPDARHWRFDLRADVTFHDGAPFGPQDVVASLSSQFDVRASGPLSVDILLSEPDSNLPFVLASGDFVIRPAHAPDAGIGTGPYRVTRFSPGQQLIATRVPQHFKDGLAGWFDRVELVSVPAVAARVQALCEDLVDGTDLADCAMPEGLRDIQIAGEGAVGRQIALPARVGTRQPLDDLRGPQRWWRA